MDDCLRKWGRGVKMKFVYMTAGTFEKSRQQPQRYSSTDLDMLRLQCSKSLVSMCLTTAQGYPGNQVSKLEHDTSGKSWVHTDQDKALCPDDCIYKFHIPYHLLWILLFFIVCTFLSFLPLCLLNFRSKRNPFSSNSRITIKIPRSLLDFHFSICSVFWCICLIACKTVLNISFGWNFVASKT